MGYLNLGEVFERGAWFHGPGDIEAAERKLRRLFAETERDHGVRLRPLDFEVLEPGHERVPTSRSGTEGRPEPPEPGMSMLVCWAQVEAPYPVAWFSGELEPRDLERMRAATRDAHRRARPCAMPLTDGQCDAVIDAVAPGTAENIIRRAVDARAVH